MSDEPLPLTADILEVGDLFLVKHLHDKTTIFGIRMQMPPGIPPRVWYVNLQTGVCDHLGGMEPPPEGKIEVEKIPTYVDLVLLLQKADT